jgi:hypothetical protein
MEVARNEDEKPAGLSFLSVVLFWILFYRHFSHTVYLYYFKYMKGIRTCFELSTIHIPGWAEGTPWTIHTPYLDYT